jgi:hypothetical protein
MAWCWDLSMVQRVAAVGAAWRGVVPGRTARHGARADGAGGSAGLEHGAESGVAWRGSGRRPGQLQ